MTGEAYELSNMGCKLCILKVRGIDDLEEEEEEVGGRCDATQDDAWAEVADLAPEESFC